MSIFLIKHLNFTKLTNKSINECTSKPSCSKNTIQQTNKKKLESVEPDTKNLSSIPQKITIPVKNKAAAKDCSDDFKTPVSLNINIVLTDEILKDLKTNGLTISINLAKQ